MTDFAHVDPLVNDLAETAILAELLANLLEDDRHRGTLARVIADRLEDFAARASKRAQERTTP